MSRGVPCKRARTDFDLGAGHDDGKTLRAPGANEILQNRKWHIQDVSIEEEKACERLILRRCRYSVPNGKAREEDIDLLLPHLSWLALAVKQNESAYPSDIRLFCPKAVVLRADGDADHVQ